MKFYEFTGEGATVIVMAKRKDVALRIAKQWASQNDLDPETFKLFDEKVVELPCVVCGWRYI